MCPFTVYGDFLSNERGNFRRDQRRLLSVSEDGDNEDREGVGGVQLMKTI